MRLHPTQLGKPVKSIKGVDSARAMAITVDERFAVSSNRNIVILAKVVKN